jgi:hypothetical protein
VRFVHGSTRITVNIEEREKDESDDDVVEGRVDVWESCAVWKSNEMTDGT